MSLDISKIFKSHDTLSWYYHFIYSFSSYIPWNSRIGAGLIVAPQKNALRSQLPSVRSRFVCLLLNFFLFRNIILARACPAAWNAPQKTRTQTHTQIHSARNRSCAIKHKKRERESESIFDLIHPSSISICWTAELYRESITLPPSPLFSPCSLYG